MFHQKILIGLKVINKHKLSKIEGFLRLFRKQGRNKENAWGKPSRIAQVVHIRYFILKMSKILHRVRFIVGIFFPWCLILLRLFYADFVRFILSTLYGVLY